MSENLIPFLERLHKDPDVQAQAAPFAGALHVVAAQFAALSAAIGLPTSAEALEAAAQEAAKDLEQPQLEAIANGAPLPESWTGGSFAAVGGAALIAAATRRAQAGTYADPLEGSPVKSSPGVSDVLP
ncbi:hypothetical protein FXN63_14115 [Pigmentiphaga aceris]|uniref:Uncharacterized protein n=1 Tax=Pigmentiphaga aceris TaxID=1940612 RepID=A0A5C0AWK0_9BURK|nr:hypothetical protein [Pigmentiphaga aceris]QEI06842.1 hypothetical protein FXN63_14115 [Pigmentiphaga aceris]